MITIEIRWQTTPNENVNVRLWTVDSDGYSIVTRSTINQAIWAGLKHHLKMELFATQEKEVFNV